MFGGGGGPGGRGRKRSATSIPYPFTPPVARTQYAQSPHFGNTSSLNVSVAATGLNHQRHWISDDARAISETVATFPAKVRAVLSRSRNMVCTVSADTDAGLAWLVTTARSGPPVHTLHVWQSHQVNEDTHGIDYHMDGWCRELQLPTSGGPLNGATSVCAVPGARPGLVAAMSNGLVIFWPDISKDISKNATIAFSSASDRVHSVVSCSSAAHGCMLVSEQGQLFHVSVRNPSGRPTLQSAPVSQSSEGVLGWGRRLVFGRGDDSTAVRAAVSRDDNEVAVLTAQKLQLWAVYPSHERPTEEVLSVEFVNSAQQPVQEELIEAVEAFGLQGTEIALLDVASVGKSVVVLAVCLTGGETTDDPLLVGCGGPDENWTWLVGKGNGHGRVNPRDTGRWKILVAPTIGVDATLDEAGAWIVDGETSRVFPTTCRPSDREEIVLACETACPEQRPMLGGHVVGHDTVVFSDWSGGCIIRVTQQDVAAAAAASAAAVAGAVASAESGYGAAAFDGAGPAATGGAIVRGVASPAHNADRLRRALSKYRAEDPTAPLFSVELDDLDCGSVQAAAALLSQEIADARKADPRWAEDDARSNSAVTSHIVQTQLQAKWDEHNLLVKLLVEWSYRGGTMWHALDESTRRTICDHGELLAAATAIRELHTAGTADPRSLGGRAVEEKRANQDFLDRAMQETQNALMTLNGTMPQNLAPTQLIELFYQDVTQLGGGTGGWAGFAAVLLNAAEGEIATSVDWNSKRRLLWLAADMLISICRRVGEHQAQNAIRYSTSYRDEDEVLAAFSRLGWMSQPPFRGALSKLYDIITEHRGPCPPEDASALLNRLYFLGDALLAGFHPSEETPESVERDFVAVRETVLAPFGAPGCVRKDLALRLATQYRDFRMLVHLCERDGEPLDRYEERYGEPFAKAKFQHYVDRHEPAKLLGQPQNAQSAKWLSDFLAPHPDLHWIERIRVGKQADYQQAGEDVDLLAQDEALDIDREVMLRSIARLCLLAAGDEHGQEAQYERLSMLEAQRMIPPEVYDAVGPPKFTSENVPPLDRREIIDLLVGNHDRIENMPLTQPSASERVVSAIKLLIQDDSDDDTKLGMLVRIGGCTVAHDIERWREMADQLEPVEALANTLLATSLRLAVDEGLTEFVAKLLEPALFEELCSLATSLSGGAPSVNFNRHLGVAIERAVRNGE